MHFGLEMFQMVVSALSSDFGQAALLVALFGKALLALTPLGPLLTGYFTALGTSMVGAGTAAGGAGATISVSVTGIGSAMAAAVGPMLAFGAAALMTGIGIGAAAAGISMLVDSLAPLSGGQLGLVAGGLVAIGLGIWGLTAGLMSLGNPVVAVGIGLLAGLGLAFTGIGLGISMAADGFEKMVNNISQVGTAATGMDNLVTGIQQLSTALDNITGDREVKFKTTLQNLALITSGRAAGMTAASAGVKEFSANIENSVKNNIELVVRLDETDIRAYIEKVHHNVGET